MKQSDPALHPHEDKEKNGMCVCACMGVGLCVCVLPKGSGGIVTFSTPVQYYDNFMYHDIFSNIAIRYFLLAIAITDIEI